MEGNISRVMLPMVQYHKQARERIIAKITETDLSKRLLPEVSSVGFLLSHVAETTYFFAHSFLKGQQIFCQNMGQRFKIWVILIL
jgi:uncharacterized damage-inducible protein DinB